MLKLKRFVIIILSISVILSIAISSELLFIFNNSPIDNEAPIPKLESLNLQNYLEHKVQKTFEAWFLRNFFMRNMLAMIKYSIDLALFNELSVVSHVRLLMGKNNHIFAIINKAGIDSGRAEVNLTTQVQEQMLERLKVIKALTNKLDKYGTQVIVVISPSKASIYKDELADKYVNKIDNPPYYNSLVKYLKELNINYIDTVEILKRRHMEYPSEVLYGKGGYHWSQYATCLAASHTLKQYLINNKSSFNIPKCLLDSNTLDGTVNDLLSHASVLNTKRFYEEFRGIKIYDSAEKIPLNKVVVLGSSFSSNLVYSLNALAQINEVSHFYYRTLRNSSGSITDLSKVDFSKIFEKADLVIIEELNVGMSLGHSTDVIARYTQQ